MAKASKKLEKVLREQLPVEQEGRAINDQLREVIRQALIHEFPDRMNIDEYDPVAQMAILANSLTLDDNLKFRLHAEIASYLYPKIRAYQAQIKEDKTLNININIKDFAKGSRSDIVIEPDDIETDDVDDDVQKAGIDYTHFVLDKYKKMDS